MPNDFNSLGKWPTGFDFHADTTCRTVFKPFILDALKALEAYDSRRPPDTAYIFHQHAKRVAGDIRDTCLHIGLGRQVAETMYWSVLPHDIGKMALPPGLWDMADKPDEALKQLRRSHTDRGVEMTEKKLGLQKHPFKDLMLDIMRHHHEQMDGGGYHGLPGEALSLPVRLASIVEAFDGWSIPRPHFGARDTAPPAVLKRMREEKLHMFDHALFEAFADMKMKQWHTRR